jgi:hypothetical protein
MDWGFWIFVWLICAVIAAVISDRKNLGAGAVSPWARSSASSGSSSSPARSPAYLLRRPECAQ